MREEWLIVICFLVGGLLVLQGPVNARLGRELGNPMHAAVVSFTTGLICVVCITLFSQRSLPNPLVVIEKDKILLIGGLLGAAVVFTGIMMVPRIGVARTAVAIICGQVIFSMLLDHFGVFDFHQISLSTKRVVSGLLVVSGVILLNWPD